jgi:hypothetical protein
MKLNMLSEPKAKITTLKLTGLLLLASALIGCAGLSTKNVRIALLHWANSVETPLPLGTTGSSELGSDEVNNNAGEIVVVGIKETQESSDVVDLEFNNFDYDDFGRSRTFSGKGTAFFSKYNDGTWILDKVSIPGKEWTNIREKAGF